MFLTLLLSAAAAASSPIGQTTTRPAGTPTTQPASQTSASLENWPAGVEPFGLNSPTATDEWFGLGPVGRDFGIDVKFIWNSHYYAVLGGGTDTGGGKHSATYDWFVTLDLDKMGLIPGADILCQVREQWGASVNRYTGATRQVNDDADGDRDMHIDQLWYRQRFFDGKIALQLGHLDYQTIADRNVYANSEDTQFMNETLDNNPMFRTASQTGLGAALTVKPCDWYSFLLGIGDAERVLYQSGFKTTFHDRALFYSYMEHTLHTKIPTARGPLPGNYRFGLMYDPVQRRRWDPPWRTVRTEEGGYGFYTSFDQMLFRESEKDEQGLGWFFRYAWRQPDHTNDSGLFNNFWSTGLAYTGLVPTRNKDTLGLAMAQLIRSPQYQRWIDRTAHNETYYELYYAIQITPWLVLTPDIQYIDNPGGVDSDHVGHAIAGGLRARIIF